MAKYGKKSGEMVKKAVRKYKKGELESGKSGKKVTSRKQAIAIGLSEAREEGAKVPAPKKSRRAPAKRITTKKAPKRTTVKRAAPKKKTTRRKVTKKK